ncbi:MAG: CBS domain-containing protein [Planctomycetes bacterium]|nr:CBS domain-containing protein [Planctomycetota bacterium]
MRIKDIMNSSPKIVRVSDTFEHLIKVLDEEKSHVIFVVDGADRLKGIVTEGDIVKVLVPKYVNEDESLISVIDENYFEDKCKEKRSVSIEEIMQKSLYTVDENDTIIKAAALMVIHRIHTLPVLRNGKLIGFLSRLALIKQITKTLSEK